MYTEYEVDREELKREARKRKAAKQIALEQIGCAPPGRRDLDLSIGDRVGYVHTLKRDTLDFTEDHVIGLSKEELEVTPVLDDEVWRIWRRNLGGGLGYVVGARTLQSGTIGQSTYDPISETGGQRYLRPFRTHRVYLVAPSMWEEHVKVLSSDLLLDTEEPGA